MDRLSIVAALAAASIAAVAVTGACGEEKQRARGSRDRVNAVHAGPAQQASPEAMCDVFHVAAGAPSFVWPKLAGAEPNPGTKTWRWVNVWATWCKPCVEELPRLLRWRARRGAGSVPVDLRLVSADESDDVVASFRAAHPQTPPSARMAEPEDLPGWLERLGVPGATLPVHVFVDPSGRVRCVRASAIEETDLPTIETLLLGG